MFADAGVPYPAREIYLRAFKFEGQLELWARPANDHALFHLVHTYPIQCASGRLGPKRREGDGQVPEGFYFVERFNPRSLFHLSLGLNYPNASDRLLTTNPAQPGSDVFIHGNAVSVGCLAMGDGPQTGGVRLCPSSPAGWTGTTGATCSRPPRRATRNWPVCGNLCARVTTLSSGRTGYRRSRWTHRAGTW